MSIKFQVELPQTFPAAKYLIVIEQETVFRTRKALYQIDTFFAKITVSVERPDGVQSV